jgi:peptide/nickel transport system permease protein
MIAYIARRLLMAFMTVMAISVLAFVIIELPEGDSVTRAMDQYMTVGSTQYNPEIVAHWRAYFGMDKPQYIRYLKWIGNLARGDMGLSLWHHPCDSLFQQRAIREVIGDRLWLTVVMTGFTVLVTWTFAIPVGIYSAVRQHSVGDYLFTFVGFSGLAVPDFLLGLVLMYIAFAYFDQSVGGLLSADYEEAPWNLAKWINLINHLWIPAIVLGTSGTAGLIRVMRNNLLDELSKPYVVTARAKGVHPAKVVMKYPVRVAINPLISTVGYLLPSLVSGSIIVSVVLSLPTLGPVLLDSIRMQDVYLAGFIVLVTGVLTVVGTLVSDILLAVADPRIKLVR